MKTESWILDTNTLIRALFNENSLPGIALKKSRETGTLLISSGTASEYFEVFSRSKFDKYVSLKRELLLSRI